MRRELMGLQEADYYVGKDVELVWLDRKGDRQCAVVFVFQAKVHPYHGPYFVTDHGDLMLDRVESVCEWQSTRRAA